MVDWVPIVFIVFKVLVFGTGMFFAIKWHYEQGKQGQQVERKALLRLIGKAVAIFVPAAVLLVFVTFAVAKHLGLT